MKQTIYRFLTVAVLALSSSVSSGYDLGQALTQNVLKMAFGSGNTGSQKSSGYAAASGDVPELPKATGDFRNCKKEFANGQPPKLIATVSQAIPLCFHGYAVLYSTANKTPFYSAAVLSRERMMNAKGGKRTDNFFEDPRIPASKRSSLADYRGSGLDRGHMQPAADSEDRLEMAQSFSLANMIPQAPFNNQKPWNGIEQATRKYVMRAQGNVYVVTGPFYQKGYCPTYSGVESTRINGGTCTIGNGVAVPSHVFKLVYDQTENRAWAHWMENTDSARAGKPISYRELVDRTGIEFLPGIQPRS